MPKYKCYYHAFTKLVVFKVAVYKTVIRLVVLKRDNTRAMRKAELDMLERIEMKTFRGMIRINSVGNVRTMPLGILSCLT